MHMQIKKKKNHKGTITMVYSVLTEGQTQQLNNDEPNNYRSVSRAGG